MAQASKLRAPIITFQTKWLCRVHKFPGPAEPGTGSGYIENVDNNGNDAPDQAPPIYTDYAGTLDDVCTVAQMCADQADFVDFGSYNSFDLHYLRSNQSWVCVQFYDVNDDPSAFNVPDEDAIAVYGYNFYQTQ